ncbi:hypothetical protein PoB_007407600 [Plakobranchus ocellatus]|uniref:Uncharacterized protein n=1 Tax=Plakobranchus ocellatus TaxID=259542 RepID=A0AAV4DU10_9GAST|nr:hypothetical protein PoB_007407600 [Plakobranchus ocellatus]
MCSTSHCLCHSASSTWWTSFCKIMSEEITPVLKSIQETLIKLETRISVLDQNLDPFSRTQQKVVLQPILLGLDLGLLTTVGPSDTVRSRAPLASVPPGSISPTEQFGAADIQCDFERIRDSLVRIPVQQDLSLVIQVWASDRNADRHSRFYLSVLDMEKLG